MKRVALAILSMALTSSAFAASIYIESRDSGGNITNINLYEEQGAWYAPGSTLKSSAPAPELPGGVLQAVGSRFSDNTVIDAVFLMKIGNHASFVAGNQYNVYITTGSSGSVDAAGSAFVLYDTAHPEGTPLLAGTVALTQANTGNLWFQVATNVTLGAGATLKVSEAAGQVNRFYADAVKIEQVVVGPTPTPTPAPTPWPTPKQLPDTPSIIVDDVPEAEFGGASGFALDPTTTQLPRLPWFYAAGTVGWENDMWYRDQRVISTNVADATATATWTFTGVTPGTYTIAYFLVDSTGYFDNTYYGISCPTTSVNEVRVVSQNGTGGVWCALAEGIQLSGTVVVTAYNIGRAQETLGTQMRVDAMGLIAQAGPTPIPPTGARVWTLFQ